MLLGQDKRFLRKNAELFAFLLTLSIWWFHDRLLEMLTPRYLALVVTASSFPWMYYGVMCCFHLVVIRITSYLSGLKCMSQSASQFCRLSRSIWSCLVSASVVMVLYRRQSSANNLALDFTLKGISLMYAKKSSGPRTIPWGTPDVTGVVHQVRNGPLLVLTVFDQTGNS